MSEQGSFTVEQWCRHRCVSRWKLYQMWQSGIGPRYYLNGPRRLISAEADLDWVRQQEALAETPEVKAAIERAADKARAMTRQRAFEGRKYRTRDWSRITHEGKEAASE
jgi:hypothetical protein